MASANLVMCQMFWLLLVSRIAHSFGLLNINAGKQELEGAEKGIQYDNLNGEIDHHGNKAVLQINKGDLYSVHDSKLSYHGNRPNVRIKQWQSTPIPPQNFYTRIRHEEYPKTHSVAMETGTQNSQGKSRQTASVKHNPQNTAPSSEKNIWDSERCTHEHPKCKYIHNSGNVITDCSKLSLDHIPYKLPWDTTKLILKGNQIAQVSWEPFQTLSDLKELDLSDNWLSNISGFVPPTANFSQDGTFGLGKVRELQLRYNMIEDISTTSLAVFLSLQRLDLSQNLLTANVTLVDFSVMPNLKFLNLSGNDKILHIPPNGFWSLHKINSLDLDLSKCEIKEFSPQAIQNILGVKSLTLSQNNLGDQLLRTACVLPAGKWKNLVVVKIFLTTLNTLEWRCKAFRSLEVLNIRENALQTGVIADDSLKAFSQLRHLDMSQCEINAFRYYGLRGLWKLQRLSLSKNKLRIIPKFVHPHTGEHFIEGLKYLDLSHNLIYYIHKKRYFSGLEKLEELYLNGNFIRFLIDNQFINLKSLRKLSIAHPKTFKYKCNKVKLTAFNISTLQWLDISKAKILLFTTASGQSHFSYLTNLTFLKAQENCLFTMHYKKQVGLFAGLKRLKHLDMTYMGFGLLNYQIFRDLENLETLKLSRNKLTKWPRSLFSPLKSLKHLAMDRNRIQTIPSYSFPSGFLDQLKTIDLSGNPFDCTCSDLWFRDWYINMTDSPKLLSKKTYKCSYPQYMKGKNLSQFILQPQDCKDTLPFILGTAGGSFVLLLTITSIVLYKKRWNIRYWCHLIKTRRRRRLYDQLCARDYIYDAFVSYNNRDRQWVIQHLLTLEKTEGFQFCLHERDFMVGQDIVDNVIESIEDSRKTILILSNSFAASQWCQFEMAMAQHKLLDDNLDVIVLVMLEEIMSDHMTARLHSLLTTKAYIKWSTEPEGQKLFWHRLKDTLRESNYPVNLPAHGITHE